MTWRLTWHPAAEWGLLNKFPIRAIAEDLDAAVIHFAETGQARVTKIEGASHAYRLRVEGAAADLFVDAQARTILVTRVFRCR